MCLLIICLDELDQVLIPNACFGRMHAQALTLGVLSAAAVFHYYDQQRAGEEAHGAAASAN